MYVPLDVNFPDDAKIEAVGLAGSGLYAQALCVAKRTMTDGRITLTKLRRLGGDDALIAACVRVDLLRTVDGQPEELQITAWLAHNDDADTVNARRTADAERKRKSRGKRPQNVQPDAADASENVRALEVEVERNIEIEPLVPPQDSLLPADPEPQSDDDIEQAVRRGAREIAKRRAATRADVTDPGGYVAAVTRSILEDPDQRTDLERQVRAGAELTDPERPTTFGGFLDGPRPVDAGAVEAARTAALRREAETQQALDAGRVEPMSPTDGVAAARAARSLLRPVPEAGGDAA